MLRRMEGADVVDVGARAVEYVHASLAVRQAAALVLLGRWLAVTRLDHPELDRLIDHLWDYLTVDASTFLSWDRFDSDVLAAALGGELPANLRILADARDVPPDLMHAVLTDVVEISYGSMFAAADDEGSLRHLADAERRLLPWGMSLPPRAAFEDAGRAQRTTADIARWRALTSRPRDVGARDAYLTRSTVLTHLVSVDDEHFPGWARVRVNLADGTTALIEDKQPVLGLDGQHAGDLVPLECQVQEAGPGDAVTVWLLHGVETTDGRDTLVVTRDQLR